MTVNIPAVVGASVSTWGLTIFLSFAAFRSYKDRGIDAETGSLACIAIVCLGFAVGTTTALL